MVRRLKITRSLPLAIALAALVALSGCGGGGGGGGGNPNGALLGVSFLGFPPGTTATIPGVFRDQTLEFTFDGPLDAGVLGGFFSVGGTPLEFQGVPPSGSQGIPYYAFVDQSGARTALQIVQNGSPIVPLASYVVGRHRDNPNIIVVDPRVQSGNPLGLPVNAGFKANQDYVYILPSGGPFTFGGSAAPGVGPNPLILPLPIPPFTNQPSLSVLFRSSAAFGPDPVPPQVISIVAQSGALGTPTNPITTQDSIVVTFSKTISNASIDLSKNFIIRNIDVMNTSAPLGILVPGSQAPMTPGATDDAVYVWTPASQYGPGPNVMPAEGFDIEVRIGSFGAPASVIPTLKGQPTGLSGTQLDLSNSLNRFFRTTNCIGCLTPTSIVEPFDNTSQRDSTFVQTFGMASSQCRWNDASAPGQLAGRLTSGSAAGNNMASLGTRVQFIVDPMPNGPGGLFSPFDASMANSGGQCPAIPTGCNIGVNLGGGSHIMHLYESANTMELNSQKDSLEQIEWASASGVTAATTYPNYKIWCGVTSIAAPLGGGAQPGLNAVFDANYNLTPYQTGIPVTCPAPTAVNPRKVPCGGPSPYQVILQTTSFFPFPLLTPPFDFATTTGASGSGVNLIFEQDIDPGSQVPNFNKYRANAFNPVRRLIDKPLIQVTGGICPFNNGGTFDIYRHRFTFVGIVGQARSLWYDTGTPNPNYLSFILSPGPGPTQPAGTSAVWILEGTDAANPVPTTNGNAAVFVNPDGSTNLNVLSTTINQLRFFRFRVEFRGNNVTNATPAFSSATMAYTF